MTNEEKLAEAIRLVKMYVDDQAEDYIILEELVTLFGMREDN